MFRKQELIQRKIQMDAYDKVMVNDMFRATLEWLEKYIEIVYKKEFPDWENRKQIHDNNIKRTDIYENPQKAEKTLSSQLHLFAATLEEDASVEFEKELKQEFYKWISAVGIDNNNCPERLKQFIFGLNEIFEGNYEKIRNDIANRRREVEMDSPEYMDKISEMFVAIQAPMREGARLEKSMRDKNPDEVEISRFNKGKFEQGQQVFDQIAESVADSHQSFYFKEQKGQSISPQQPTNSQIIQDFKQNPQSWRIDEVITEYDNYGKATKKELALIHNSAEVGYDGSVLGDNQPVYLANRFNQAEIAEINQALNISQPSTSTSSQYDRYQQKQLAKEKVEVPKISNPNKGNSGLGTAFLISSVLAVASGTVYGVSSIVKKSKKTNK